MNKSSCLVLALVVVVAAMPQTKGEVQEKNLPYDNEIDISSVAIPISLMTRVLDDYFISQTPMDYYGARLFCKTLGQELVSLCSFEDQINYTGFLSFFNANDKIYWTSGTRLSGPWTWGIDGSTFNYTRWAPGQPDNKDGIQECVATLAKSILWDDDNCDVEFNFVCEKPRK